MKKILKWVGIALGVILLLLLIAYGAFYVKASRASNANLALLGPEAKELTENGTTFRDLNKNGTMDIYENPNATIDDRVDDLVGKMTLEEKAGSMFITMIGTTADGEPLEKPFLSSDIINIVMAFVLPSNSEMIAKQKMNSFNTLASLDADLLAKYNNKIQKMAERTRLGIPITIATDPRHGTENNPGAALYTPAFSQWPTSLGLAATRDTAMVREFGNVARQEYLATGFRLALHPMADLATEPRWGRINGTFGEDANLSAEMTKAYVLGFQGDSLTNTSVACMTKHFSGGGPQKDGEDAHFRYGKDQVYPGNNFDYHVIPFTKGAFEANTAQIMPYYGIPVDQTSENTGFAFNKDIITILLRDSLNFDGVVCTDWNIITESFIGEPRGWGVDGLSVKEKVKKVLEAGCDQFGGENIPEVIVELVKEGSIPVERLDISVKRIMLDKFRLGLFDNPYVDVAAAAKIAGKKEFMEKGIKAQQKSVILLKNDNILPLKKGTKIYAEGMLNHDILDNYGTVVDKVEDADVVIKRITSPYEPRNGSFMESFFHQGRLYFDDDEKKEILGLITKKPSIVVINLERPIILTEINDASNALMADFGTSDEALAPILFGQVSPNGKLPFELPSSWKAVEDQFEDIPYDSKDPLYPFGYGLTY